MISIFFFEKWSTIWERDMKFGRSLHPMNHFHSLWISNPEYNKLNRTKYLASKLFNLEIGLHFLADFICMKLTRGQRWCDQSVVLETQHLIFKLTIIYQHNHYLEIFFGWSFLLVERNITFMILKYFLVTFWEIHSK